MKKKKIVATLIISSLLLSACGNGTGAVSDSNTEQAINTTDSVDAEKSNEVNVSTIDGEAGTNRLGVRDAEYTAFNPDWTDKNHLSFYSEDEEYVYILDFGEDVISKMGFDSYGDISCSNEDESIYFIADSMFNNNDYFLFSFKTPDFRAMQAEVMVDYEEPEIADGYTVIDANAGDYSYKIIKRTERGYVAVIDTFTSESGSVKYLVASLHTDDDEQAKAAFNYLRENLHVYKGLDYDTPDFANVTDCSTGEVSDISDYLVLNDMVAYILQDELGINVESYKNLFDFTNIEFDIRSDGSRTKVELYPYIPEALQKEVPNMNDYKDLLGYRAYMLPEGKAWLTYGDNFDKAIEVELSPKDKFPTADDTLAGIKETMFSNAE